jgi:hypothetical protein
MSETIGTLYDLAKALLGLALLPLMILFGIGFLLLFGVLSIGLILPFDMDEEEDWCG